MNTTTNPLARILTDAQAILADHDRLTGPSKADTIKLLNDLLRSPEANDALLSAETYADRKVAEARAALAPALESAQHKLNELRGHYDGIQGMSIDRVLTDVGTALALALAQAGK
jgi:hypothetical protein